MSTLSSKVLVLAFASLAIASLACTLASPTEVQLVPAKQDSDVRDGTKTAAQTAGSDGKADGKTCAAKLAKVDVSKLTACGDSGGHCYPKSKVPGGGAGALPCEKADEVCVADVILEAGGDKLTACHVQAMGGAEGVCIPLGPIAEGPEKELAKTNLKQDVCAEGLVCSPCVDIRTNTSTGLCGPVGVSEGTCGGGSDSATTSSTTTKAPAAAPTCCGGKGTCMPNTISDKMSKDTCTGDLVCAPMALTQGKATKCDSRLGAGICLDACFNDMLALGGMILGQDKCADSESCIPCTLVSMMAPDGAQVPGCEDN
jgi:hypothetical protein